MSAAVLPQRATSFTIQPLGAFSLHAAARFWGDFTPAAHGGLDTEGHLHMAFPVEGDWRTAGVCLQEHDGLITGDVFGDVNPDVMRQQTARILSLDVDGRALSDVAMRDPVSARLLQQAPGLRPVCFHSPYEAGVWAIISHGIRMRQAATIKRRLAEAFGETVSIHGQPMLAFPSPNALLSLEPPFPGLFGNKAASLRAIAIAALAGDLDAKHLRGLPDETALSQLQSLPGIGPFSAELILLRGCGHPDVLTLREPRFRHAVAEAYGLDREPTDADLQRIGAVAPVSDVDQLPAAAAGELKTGAYAHSVTEGPPLVRQKGWSTQETTHWIPLIEPGARTTRSDAGAWLMRAGIEANDSLFNSVRDKMAQIRQLRERGFACPGQPGKDH